MAGGRLKTGFIPLLSALEFFFFFLLLSLHSCSAAKAQEKGVFNETVVVDSSSTYFLPYPYLDPATLEVLSINRQLSEPDDYIYSSEDNSLFLKTLQPGDSISVSFFYLPIEMESTFQLHHPIERSELDSLSSKEDGSSLDGIRDRLSSNSAMSNLRRQGSIMRGVQVGTGKDVSLESGLHLSLEGKISRDIEVRALLDDRNLPIQPEGTSSRLSELDQVYIDVKTGDLHGRFGDYHLKQSTGRYGTFDRKLEGGLVDYTTDNVKVQASGAVTKAVYHTNSMNGTDGVQGPYLLTGKDGEQNFIVLAGSEKIWIDGKRVQRGQNNDYIIDYNRGEITFTPSRPISSESRITIDFEYVPDAFPRNLYSGSLKYHSSDRKYKAGFSFIQEGDDYKNPLNFDMNDSFENQLKDAGDISQSVQLSSAEYLGAGKADYTKIDTTWIDDGQTYEIFSFVQPDDNGNALGDWSVLFSEVGSGEGDYSREYDTSLGNYRFEWVGPGRGSWAPVRIVSLPERHRHSAFNFEASPNRYLNLKSDFGVSDYDPNVLSDENRSEQVGLAQNYEANIYPFFTKKKRAPVALNFLYRDEGARYIPFGRTNDVEYGRTWGQDSLRSHQKVKQQESGIRISPIRDLNFSGQYATLQQGVENGNYFESDRYSLHSDFTSKRLNYNSTAERIISDDEATQNHSDWIRFNGSINSQITSLFIPGVEGEWEKRKSVYTDTNYQGFIYERVKGYVSLADYKGHSGTIHLQNRSRDLQVGDKDFIDSYNETSTGILWNLRKRPGNWRSSVQLSHTVKDFAISDSTDVTTDLAEVRAGWLPLGGAFSSDFAYQLNKTVTRPSALIAYQVPTGEGEYIRVGDEYIYDPEIGDIVLIPEPTGEALPTTDLGTSIHMDWSPHRLPDGKGIIDGFGWEDISLTTDIQIREVTRWDKTSDIYLLNLSKFQSDSTIEGNMSWRQDIHFFRPNKDFNYRVRYYAIKRKNNLYGTGSETYGQDSWEMRIQNRVANELDLETESEYERRNKNLSQSETGHHYILLRLSSKLTWRPSKSWRYSVQVRGLLDSEKGVDDNVTGYGIKPGLSWSIRDRGRITADFEALWIISKLDELPYDLADGRPKGRNGRIGLRADYNIGRNISMRAVYNSRLDQDKKPIHLARLEITSSF